MEGEKMGKLVAEQGKGKDRELGSCEVERHKVGEKG